MSKTRLLNYLRSHPWHIIGKGRWRYGAIYRSMRVFGTVSYVPSRRKALWYTITFPHTHDEDDF